MNQPEVTVADLVPLADRLRWMLTYRAAVVAFIPLAAATGIVSGAPFGGPFLVAAGWLVITTLTLLAHRLGRTTALSVFTASMLGDGLLLGALRPYLGWIGSPVEIVVVGHVVAVTLLASFRTGAKITLWHLLVCFLVLESRAAGLVGPAVDVPLPLFAAVASLLWLIMLATASFAAVNERELRRRRYDIERLHVFGAAAARMTEPAGVAALLAEFARDELLARRVAVLIYPQPSAVGPAASPIAYVVGPDGGGEDTVPEDLPPGSVLREAMDGEVTILAARRSEEHDPVLAGLLPDARALILVPFHADELSGLLVMEHPRRSSQRSSRRVELRVIDTAEEATGQASLAIGRALLLARARTDEHPAADQDTRAA